MGKLIRGISKNARFFVADTTDVVQEALDIDKYDEYSMKIFGKFCTLASLMGATLKGEDKLTIRTDTDGYIKNIVVTSDANENIKGYLVNTTDENFDGLGKGTMRIIKDMGLKEPYVAIRDVYKRQTLNENQLEFIKSSINGIVQNYSNIKDTIKKNTKNWAYERLKDLINYDGGKR